MGVYVFLLIVTNIIFFVVLLIFNFGMSTTLDSWLFFAQVTTASACTVNVPSEQSRLRTFSLSVELKLYRKFGTMAKRTRCSVVRNFKFHAKCNHETNKLTVDSVYLLRTTEQRVLLAIVTSSSLAVEHF